MAAARTTGQAWDVPSRRTTGVLVAFWLAAAVLATGVGVLAVRLVARQVGDPAVPVLSSRDIARAPSPTPPAAASASPTRTVPAATPRALPATTPFSTTGGAVGVRCRGPVPERVYATPAQGWMLDETSVEGGVLEVRFTQGRTRSRISIACRDGAPVAAERRVDSSGGGG